MIRAIQTTYAGHKFRSRLEARWACFFNAAGIKWQYECEGFHVRDRKYLPDFYLPESRMWVEVKGDWAAETDDYFEMLFALASNDSPLPHMEDSAAKEFGGLVLLGPIPPESKTTPIFMGLVNDASINKTATIGSLCFEKTINRSQLELWYTWPIDSGNEIKKRVPEQRFASGMIGIPQRNASEKAYRIARQARFEFGETPKC